MTGYLFAALATAIWSGNFIIACGLSDQIPPVSLAFSRWLVAVIVLFPFVCRALVAERRLIRQHVGYLALTGLFGVGVFNTLIYIAGHTTTAINLTLIAICFPVFIVLLSRFFYGEVIGLRRVGGILVVISGVVILTTRGDLSVLANLSFASGDLWMLCASFVFALYALLVKRKPQAISFWTFQFCTFFFGLVFLGPFFVWEVATTSAVEWSGTVVIGILYAGIFASLGAFGLWNQAVLTIGPSRAGLIYYTLPLFSSVWAVLLLHEQVVALHFICAALILSGIVVASSHSSQK